MNREDDGISIRELQHYMYCPHRWGLIYVDCSWMENYFVTKANLLHERVHDPNRAYTSRQKKVFTSVTVFHDILGLYGVTDCIEMDRNSQLPGLSLQKRTKGISSDNKCSPVQDPHLTIIEYKPQKPRKAEFNQDDLMQVFAQKVCLDWMFDCKAQGIIYYADVKERVKLPLDERYEPLYSSLEGLLKNIRKYRSEGVIPAIRKGQKCRGCSFLDLCLPKADRKRRKPFFDELKELCSDE